MRLTQETLKQIIKEELENLTLQEVNTNPVTVVDKRGHFVITGGSNPKQLSHVSFGFYLDNDNQRRWYVNFSRTPQPSWGWATFIGPPEAWADKAQQAKTLSDMHTALNLPGFGLKDKDNEVQKVRQMVER